MSLFLVSADQIEKLPTKSRHSVKTGIVFPMNEQNRFVTKIKVTCLMFVLVKSCRPFGWSVVGAYWHLAVQLTVCLYYTTMVKSSPS